MFLMEVKAEIGKIDQFEADMLLIYLMVGGPQDLPDNATKAIDNALEGALQELLVSGEFTGEEGQITVLYPRSALPAKRVIVTGLGAVEKFSAHVARKAVTDAVRKAASLKAQQIATVTLGTGRGGLDTVEAARIVAEAALMATYHYHGQKTSENTVPMPESMTILAYAESDLPMVIDGVKQGQEFAAGANLARNLVNLPANICTPSYMAEQATIMAESNGLRVLVLEKQQMLALKMGALLAVAQGSDSPPRFIVLEHNADRADELDTVVLVGKGVTFDTGGYSIKSRDGMIGMKADMGGGAAVIGAMRVISGLEVPLHVVGLIPASDNMINGSAYRPQDVVTASNGKTIEIISTDAEGRMLLADSLVYAKRYEPDAVVDIATLTGACVVALGNAAAGLFSTDDTLRDAILSAAEVTGDRVWPLPLYPEYEETLQSDTADMKNTGGRGKGVGTSAAFLKQFVDYPRWAHIDMAAMVTDDKGLATGFGARLLADFTRQWIQK